MNEELFQHQLLSNNPVFQNNFHRIHATVFIGKVNNYYLAFFRRCRLRFQDHFAT